MSITRAVSRALVLSTLAVLVLASTAVALDVGQKAPDFALNGTDGKPVNTGAVASPVVSVQTPSALSAVLAIPSTLPLGSTFTASLTVRRLCRSSAVCQPGLYCR